MLTYTKSFAKKSLLSLLILPATGMTWDDVGPFPKSDRINDQVEKQVAMDGDLRLQATPSQIFQQETLVHFGANNAYDDLR